MLKYTVWYYYFQFFNIVLLTQKTKKMTFYEVTQHATTYPGLGQVVTHMGVGCNTFVMIPITSHLD